MYLITGVAGFIGSHLAEKLLKEGYEILGLDIINDYYDINKKLSNLEILTKYPNFKFIKEDATTSECINKYNPNVVIHLASYAGVRYSIDHPITYSTNNINSQINLLQQCINKNIRFIYASSSSVYGKINRIPFSEDFNLHSVNSPYALSKKVMEEYAKFYSEFYNIETIGLRFFTVYGPRGRPDMAPYKFLSNIMNCRSIDQYGNGKSLRDYTYIDDIVDGIIGAINNNHPDKYNIYNLGNHSPISLRQFIKKCELVCNKNAIINKLPDRPGDVDLTYANIDRAKKILGFSPKITLDLGLKNTYEWLKSQEIAEK